MVQNLQQVSTAFQNIIHFISGVNFQISFLSHYPSFRSFSKGIYRISSSGVDLIHLVGEQMETILQIVEIVLAG